MKRTSFTRFRYGEASGLAITPAWLEVRRAVAGLTTVGQGAAAFVRCKIDWDVRAGDVLKEADGRLFAVQQVRPEQATQMLLCSELSAIIPDEFESGIINAFWTVGAAGSWAQMAGTSTVMLTPPTGTKPEDAGFLSQPVTGDFDVAAWVCCTTGTVLDVQWALLGARTAADNGVYLALRDDGAGMQLVRVDEVAGVVTETALAMDAHWLRVKRVGCDFLTYYSANRRGVPEIGDWVLLPPGGAALQTAGAVSVGLGGYATGAGSAIKFDCVRNL
jgi:hypothetical protein